MRTTKGVTTANEAVEPLVLTEDHAYVRTNIKPINEPGTEDTPGFKGFSYDETEYTKDEYIISMSNEFANVNILLETMLGGVE